MKISFFKIGTIIAVIGIIWISYAFLQGDKIKEDFSLNPMSSHKVNLDFYENGIGYYQLYIKNFSGKIIFIQILDERQNVISEEIIQTKMSVGYFDFEKSGKYTISLVNPSEEILEIGLEFGNTNSENMILPGIMVFLGSIILLVVSYLKLSNYKIEHPEENIS